MATGSTATRTSAASARSSLLRDQGVSAVEASRRVLAAERAGTTVSAEDGDGRHGAEHPGAPARGRAGAGGAAGGDPASEGRDAGASPLGLRTDPPMLVAQLLDAITALDEDRAHAVLDTAFVERSVESAIIDVLLPLFVRVGEMWELGRIGIAQEHFASSLVRRRLGALSLTWGVGNGPVAVLACPPGEFHDIVLLSFGVLLGRAGWRIRYLGPDTPGALPRRRGAPHPGGCRRARLPPPVRLPGPRPRAAPARRGAPGLDRRPRCHPPRARGGGRAPPRRRPRRRGGRAHRDGARAPQHGRGVTGGSAPRAEEAAERQDAVTASGHGATNRTRAGEPSRRRTQTSA